MVIVSVHAVVAIIRELSEISSSNNPSEASLTSAVAASSTGKEDANLNLLLQQQARVDGGQPLARIMGIPTEVEDAILQLSGVVTFDQLEESVRDALELTLPNVSDVVVYVLNPDTQELVSSHSLVHTLPREGLPLNAIQKRERVLVSELDPSDPISGLITFSPNGATTSRKVLCSPVVDKETDKVIAVFVVVCNNLSKEDHEHLNFLERQFLVCYRRLKLTGAASSKISSIVGVSAGKERRNSASPILKLCAELCDQDAASLQVKVLRYLLQQTQSQSGFLLLVDLDHRELFCQVIGQSILKEELRFPIEKSNFNSALKSKKTMLLADLSASHRQELERELDVRLESLLCVPVINTATDAVTALACLLNKADGDNYDEADIETVQHCFKYTSTVLHSTVAVQNERTLKNQTQALLQVARNLFTHLGEFLFSATTDYDLIDQGRLRAMGRTDDWPGMASDSCPFVFLNNRAKDHDKLSLPVDFIRTCFRDFPNVTDLRKTVAQQHPQSNRPDKVGPRDAALMDGAKKEVVAKEGLADSRKLADGTGNPIERFSGAAKKDMPVKDGLTDDRVRADLSSCEVLGKGQHEMDELSRKTSGKGSIEAVSCSENDVTQIATGIAQIAIDKKDVSEVALNVQDLHRFGSSLTAESSTSGGALSTASSGTKELLNTAFMNISSHSLESKSSSIKGTGCTKYPAQAPKALWRSETFDDLTRLLREIMQEARTLTKAERCSVFLLEKENNELVAKVFDGDVQEGKEQIIQSEVRIPADQGIAGHVATTGELLNIDDAYSHPLFYRGVDETTGFRTRNILCFPIKEKNDEVIGVAQLCNKINGAGFSSFDEDIAQAFSVFCCMSIVHSLMYKSVRDSQHRSKLSNELITYHMQVPHEEVQMLSIKEFPSPQEINIHFDKFFFIPRNLPYDKTSVAVISMFEDMGFISKYRINKETLAKFVLMVRKGYRDPPYHNWAHAFAVAHFCYLINKNTNLGEYLDDLEIFALFVACLCHDIDHRGTTNSYQVASDSVLAALYSSEGSVMERHHFAQTMCIINLEGCNIFDNLSKSEYEKVLDMMRDIILATDLAHHLRILKDLQTMADVGINRDKKSQRMLLLCLIMTCCDLSDQTKTWTNSKQIAELIYMEFFSQGDLERALGHSPSEMMDREKACIPQLQLGFLDGIALPVFRILTQIFPDASVVVKAVENNRRMWTKVVKILSELGLPTNMEVFKLPQLEEDFLNTNDS